MSVQSAPMEDAQNSASESSVESEPSAVTNAVSPRKPKTVKVSRAAMLAQNKADARKAPAARRPKHKVRHSLTVAHHTPGRVRMKVPTAKGDPEALQRVAAMFNGVPGVESVSINPTTGSLVLNYNHRRSDEVHEQITDKAARANIPFRPPETDIDKLTKAIESEAKFLAQHSHSAKAIVDFFIHLDHEIKRRSHNYVDLKIMLAAGLVAVTILEIGATAATPVWLTLIMFGANHMIQLHQQSVMDANEDDMTNALTAATV